MKIIKVTTKMGVTVHDYPDGNIREQNKVLNALIGEQCSFVERVKPCRLYDVWKMTAEPSTEPGKAVSMLVDEEGWYHGYAHNMLGCYLYGTDYHFAPILGDVLFVGETLNANGEIDFTGLDEVVFSDLLKKINDFRQKLNES